MTYDDLERELRSLALVPHEDAGHREELAARLRHRFQARRRRNRAIVTAAVFLLLTAGSARHSRVVSYGYRYTEATPMADSSGVVFMRYPEDRFTHTVSLRTPASVDEIDHLRWRAEVSDALHDAGLDVPVSLFGIACEEKRQLFARYMAVAGAETLSTSYTLEEDLTDLFLSLVQSGRYREVLRAAAADLLPRLPDTLVVVDGVTFRLRRWLAHAPETGDFVLLKGSPVERPSPDQAALR